MKEKINYKYSTYACHDDITKLTFFIIALHHEDNYDIFPIGPVSDHNDLYESVEINNKEHLCFVDKEYKKLQKKLKKLNYSHNYYDDTAKKFIVYEINYKSASLIKKHFIKIKKHITSK